MKTCRIAGVEVGAWTTERERTKADVEDLGLNDRRLRSCQPSRRSGCGARQVYGALDARGGCRTTAAEARGDQETASSPGGGGAAQALGPRAESQGDGGPCQGHVWCLEPLGAGGPALSAEVGAGCSRGGGVQMASVGGKWVRDEGRGVSRAFRMGSRSFILVAGGSGARPLGSRGDCAGEGGAEGSGRPLPLPPTLRGQQVARERRRSWASRQGVSPALCGCGEIWGPGRRLWIRGLECGRTPSRRLAGAAPPPAPPRGCTSGCPQASRRVPCSIPRAPDLADWLGVHFRGSCEI